MRKRKGLISADDLLDWLYQREKHYDMYSPKKAKAMQEVMDHIDGMEGLNEEKEACAAATAETRTHAAR